MGLGNKKSRFFFQIKGHTHFQGEEMAKMLKICIHDIDNKSRTTGSIQKYIAQSRFE